MYELRHFVLMLDLNIQNHLLIFEKFAPSILFSIHFCLGKLYGITVEQGLQNQSIVKEFPVIF